MKIFLTGATGFLGRRVAARLVAAGHQVSALVRSPGIYSNPAGVTVIPGDLEDLSTAEEALADSQVVVHLASIVATWEPWARYQRVVVDATTELLRAAQRHGVERFVYLSTEAVMQDRAGLLDIDESHPMPAKPSSRYGRAKRAAEQAIGDHEGPIERVILRPPFIWGDDRATLDQLARMAQDGKLPLFDNGNASFEHIHVDNAADAVVAAVTRGRDRGVYFITNDEPLPTREFLSQVLAAYGAPLPTRSLPARPLRSAATLLEKLWTGLRLPGAPPLTAFEVEFLSLPRRYRIAAAQRDLGYHPAVSLSAGVARLTAARATHQIEHGTDT